MTAHELLAELASAGLCVTAEGGRLIVLPASRLTNAMRAALRSAKPELVPILEGGGEKVAGQEQVETGRDQRGDLDDRVVCIGCRHYQVGRCRNHRRAGLATSEVGRALAALPQRCPGFGPCGCLLTISRSEPAAGTAMQDHATG